MDFFTWTQLGTSAGAVAATMLIVQFTRKLAQEATRFSRVEE